MYHDLVINADRSYKYYVVLTSAIHGNGGEVLFANIKFYGHKEGDLTRFPEPTRVLKYPHVAMTGPGQRGYVASASSSSVSLYRPWRAFNDIVTGNDVWTTNGTPYNTSNGSYSAGVYSTTVVGHGAAAGEFGNLKAALRRYHFCRPSVTSWS